MTRKKPDRTPAPSGNAKSTAFSPACPATGRARLVLVLGGLSLVLVFASSFIYRFQHPGLHVRADHPDISVEDMPPAMSPDGVAGAGTPGMPNGQAMAKVGALMMKIKQNPNDPELLTEMGEYFITARAFDKAQIFLARALVSKPADIKILDLLAMSLFELGEHKQAVGYYEQIAALDPENAGAQYNLGMIYVNFLNDPERGRQHLRTALDLPGAPEEVRQRASAALSGKSHPTGAEQPASQATPTDEKP